jgi:hypothetical protein
MKAGISLLLTFLAVCPAFAAGTQQLDWSGGPGVPGPVTYWEEFFSGCSMMSFDGVGGFLVLTYSSVLHWIHRSGPGCDEMVVVDTDGDGDRDVVGTQATWDRISHWENLDGYGGSWARTIIASSLESVVSIDCIDIDGDGDPDLALGTEAGPYWLENAGSGWVTHQVGTLYSQCIRAGDIDGDGDPDLAASYRGSHSGRWFENIDGSGGEWQEHTVWQGQYGAYCLKLADMDTDGDLDALISQEVPPNVVYFENLNGQGGSWEAHVVCSTIGSAYLQVFGVEAFDLDQDGDLDVIAAGSDPMPEGAVIWIENVDGFGATWLKHSIDNDLVGANSVDAADLDGDGDLDVMATAGEQWGEDWVMWYENVDGQATAWNGHVLDTTTGDASDVTSADLDKDDDLDVVLSDRVAGMRWYEFTRASSGGLESSILDPPGGSQEQWTDLSWDATVPPGTILTFQVRASNDPSDMGEWSPAFAVQGSIAQYLPEPAWYFQYRVNMVTGVPPTSPTLDKVLVQYDPVGIEGDPEAGGPTLTILSGNPSRGTVMLDVYLPDAGSASLGIYDLAGRLVSEPLDGSQEAGYHQMTVSDLPTGCYSVLLRTPTESIRSMLVVLR